MQIEYCYSRGVGNLGMFTLLDGVNISVMFNGWFVFNAYLLLKQSKFNK